MGKGKSTGKPAKPMSLRERAAARKKAQDAAIDGPAPKSKDKSKSKGKGKP